jgi:hypothetical protein
MFGKNGEKRVENRADDGDRAYNTGAERIWSNPFFRVPKC